MTRTDERITRTLDHVASTTTVSPDALETMASRRQRSRGLSRLAGTGLVAAGLATVLAVGVMTRVGAPAIDGSGSDVMGSPTTTAPGTGGVASDPWVGLTYTEAVDRLLVLTDELPDVPVPTATEDLVYDVVTVSGWMGGDGDVGEMVQRTTHIDVEGLATITTASFGEVMRSGGLDHWRDVHASATPSVVDTRTEDAEKHAMTDELRRATLADAQAQAAGTHEPDPQATERPPQAYAFMLAGDLLRGTAVQSTAVASQREALELIRDLDPSLVGYGGTVDAVTGTEVVVLRAFDRANDGWNILLFDAETGRFAGDGMQVGEGEWFHTSTHSAPRLEPKG